MANWTNPNVQQITPLVQSGSVSASGGFLTMSNPTQNYTILNMANVSQFASYDLNGYLYASPAGANLDGVCVEFILQWYDDEVSGIPVFEEDWWVWVGRGPTSQGLNSLAASGPMHGQYMTVIASLPALQNAPTIFQYFNLFGSNRIVPYSDWRQNAQTVNPEIFNLTTTLTSQIQGTSFDNVLGGVTAYVSPANQVTFVPLGLYSGPVYWRYSTGAAPNTLPLFASVEQQAGGTILPTAACPNIIQRIPTATTEANGTFLAPRSPVIFIFQSTATPASINLEVIAQQAA